MDTRTLILTLSEWLGVAAILMLAGLSPRLQIPQVGFKYPRREGMVALSLYVVILAIRTLFATGSMGSTTAASLRGGALDIRLLVAAFALVPFILALLIRRQPPRSAGWYGKALGGAVRVGSVLAALTIILHGKALSLLNGISPEEGRALVFWLGICLAEETIFRGYIQLRLSWWWGPWRGLLATALLSLIWDWPLLVSAGGNPALAIAVSAVRFVLLGWIAQKSRHTIAPFLYRAVSEWLLLVL